MNTHRMSCTEAREKLPLYVGGDLDREVQETLRSHLERCADCHRLVQEAVAARRELVLSFRERVQGPKPDLWSGIRAQLVAEGRILEDANGRPVRPLGTPDTFTRVPRPLRWSRALAPLAAAAVLLGVLQLSGVFSELSSGKPIRPAPTPRDGGSIVVAPSLPPALNGGLIQVPAHEALTQPAKYRDARGTRTSPATSGDVSLTSLRSNPDWK
jgi:hypothetical protein